MSPRAHGAPARPRQSAAARGSALIALAFGALSTGAQTPPPGERPDPWRASDTVLVSLCFDRLGMQPPPRLELQSVGGDGAMSARAELVARTLGGDPVYEASLDHPARWRHAVLRLPGQALSAWLDAPEPLARRIDLWGTVPLAGCDAGPGTAQALARHERPAPGACPDLGLHVSVKVAAAAEHALTLRDVRDRGPRTLNGLRHCQEPA